MTLVRFQNQIQSSLGEQFHRFVHSQEKPLPSGGILFRVVTQGEVGGDATALLTREDIRRGVVLACQSTVQSNLHVEIPQETRAGMTGAPISPGVTAATAS